MHCSVLLTVDGVFGDWSEWSECTLTCGGGGQWRNRTCNGPFHGGNDCLGVRNETQECNSHSCPGWLRRMQDCKLEATDLGFSCALRGEDLEPYLCCLSLKTCHRLANPSVLTDKLKRSNEKKEVKMKKLEL